MYFFKYKLYRHPGKEKYTQYLGLELILKLSDSTEQVSSHNDTDEKTMISKSGHDVLNPGVSLASW